MKLAKYIYELLLENETVIIPGFGAFVSKYKPAEIGNYEIKPPSKEISFTGQIRNNDGVLVTAVARKAKISQPNALKRIERACENMLYQLDKGEKITLEDLGTLFYNEQNEIQFTPFQDDNLLLDSFGLETISMEDTVEKTVEVEKENEAVSTLLSEKIKLPEFKPAPVIEKPTESKKTNWYWYLLILLPILIAGYFIFRHTTSPNKAENNYDQTSNTGQMEIQIQTINPEDSARKDSVMNSETGTLEIGKHETGLAEGTPKYYLVGGGFKNEENAEKYIIQLNEKGFEGSLLGKRGNMYLVGIATFDSETEAYNSLNEHLKKYPGWNLWVYKK